MEVKVRGSTNLGTFSAKITDEHDGSVSGQPVLLMGGRRYGPGDVHPFYGMIGNVRLTVDREEQSGDAGRCIFDFYRPLGQG